VVLGVGTTCAELPLKKTEISSTGAGAPAPGEARPRLAKRARALACEEIAIQSLFGLFCQSAQPIGPSI